MVVPCSRGTKGKKTYRQTMEGRVFEIPNTHTCVLSFSPVLRGIDGDIDDGGVSASGSSHLIQRICLSATSLDNSCIY